MKDGIGYTNSLCTAIMDQPFIKPCHSFQLNNVTPNVVKMVIKLLDVWLRRKLRMELKQYRLRKSHKANPLGP